MQQFSPNRRSPLAALALLVLGALILPGCSGWATYPPIEGATQIGHPKLEPVPSIMAEAIRYAHDRYLHDGEIVFNLPEGCGSEVYESVKLRLNSPARPLLEAGQPAVHVNAVRIRAMDAQVDVVYPRSDGHYELVTLFMRQKFLHKYEVRDTRLWRIHVSPPQPRYEPPPAPEPAADAATTPSEPDGATQAPLAGDGESASETDG